MENNILNYQSKRGVHVPKDVKEYILKRVKEGSKTLKAIAVEHGISVSAISSWIKDDVGGLSDSSFLKLQKENQLLKQLVAELSLKIRESEKRGW
jgi:transposase-like protein